MSRTLLTTLAVTTALALGGCLEYDTPPAGSYSEVLLVLEKGERSEWVDELVPIITNERDYVISIEPAFKVTVIQASQLEEFPTYKNIILFGVLESSTRVGERMLSLVGQNGAERIMSGKANIMKRENMPAPGQVTLVFAAPNEDALRAALETRGPELPEILESSCRQRLRRHLLARANTALTEELYRRYGFHLEFPYLYRLFSEEADPPGIELLREPPTRVLGVFWADWQKAPSLYRPDELFDMRAHYVWERYDHDKMDRDKVRYTWVRFGAYDAIRMAGYWYNDKAVVGGYFETYFIWDESSKLMWAVDLLAFAPGRPKHPLMREMKALGETFRYD